MDCCDRTLVTIAMVTALVDRDTSDGPARRVVKGLSDNPCFCCKDVRRRVAEALVPGDLVGTIKARLADLFLEAAS
jgi:hypothetical protein